MANKLILEKLEGVKHRFNEVGELLMMPDIMSDMKRYVKLNKEFRELKPIIEAYDRYNLTLKNIDSARALLVDEKDEEMREMAKDEIEELN